MTDDQPAPPGNVPSPPSDLPLPARLPPPPMAPDKTTTSFYHRQGLAFPAPGPLDAKVEPVKAAPTERASTCVEPAAGRPVSSKEDIPFPLPPDWYERKAAKQAAEKAAQEAAEAAAIAAAEAEKAAPAAEAAAALPPRTRPSAELLRAAAQRASGEYRHEASHQHRLQGDALAGQGRWKAAAVEYEHAARKAATPEEARLLVAEAGAARARGRGRRLMGIAALAVVALAILAAAGWWTLGRRGAAGDDAETTAHPLGSSAAATTSAINRGKGLAVLADLEAMAADEQRPWSAVAAAAQAALLQPNMDIQRVRKVLDRAAPEAAGQARDFAAVQAERLRDPAAALALAAAFRHAHQRAGDFAAQLPLPGRLALRGAADATCVVTIDGEPLPAAALDSVVFCRSGLHPVSLVVESPGYQRAALDIPANPALDELPFSVQMREAPLWMRVAPTQAPGWLALVASGEAVAVIQPAAVQALAVRDGGVLATLDAHAVSGVPASACTWTGLADAPPGELWLATSNGALIATALDAHGFAAARLLHLGERAIANLGRGKLVFQLDKPAWFSATLPPKAELAAECDGRKLWSVPLTASLPPHLHVRGEHEVAVDDLALTVFDQEGKSVRSVPLPGRRSGPVLSFADGQVLVAACAEGVAVLSDRGQLDYQATLLAGAVLASQADGELLLGATADHAVALWRLVDHAFQPQWQVHLPGGRAPVQLGLAGGYAGCADDGDALHCVDLRDHAVVRTIQLDEPALAAPLVVGGCVVVGDRLGQLRAYTLARPGGKR